MFKSAFLQSRVEIFSANKINGGPVPESEYFTCYHCRTGIVRKLPARCPECDRLLTEPIVQKRDKKKN
jgi:hypothetical protein